MRVVSLAAVNVSIKNDAYGNISIGGGGKMVGSIAYEYENNIFNIESTPDGGAAASHNASKAGSITITIKQTSPQIKELNDFIRWCWDNPTEAVSAITINDNTQNMVAFANDVLPQKLPNNTISETTNDRQYTFLAGTIITSD
jgi:hypothetical protein